MDVTAHRVIPSDYRLRGGIRGGGGRGVAYALGFDKPKAGDQHYEISGSPALLEKKHLMLLMGMKIDFYEGTDARGFTFVNPGAEARNNASEQQGAGRENG